MKTVELDIIFLSYDEPNADINFSDLSNKVPWAKRIHGVKGSDAAHKAAADLSDTDWFITIDADNIVDSRFFNLEIDTSDPKIKVYGWCGRNNVNGLRYGNGGIKIWSKDFVTNMKTHEAAESQNAQVDFCWEDGYRNFPMSFSESRINCSTYQAWRAGFREGVKMTLLDGVKLAPMEIIEKIWWHNIHRLKVWSTVGAHVENGLFAVYGARLGTWMANCTDWDYVQVRDFEHLKCIYNETAKHFENNQEKLFEEIKTLGYKIKTELGIEYADLNSDQSKYCFDMYNETIELCKTYYRMSENV